MAKGAAVAMSVSVLFLLLGVFVIGAVPLLLALIILIRVSLLHSRSGSFPAFLLVGSRWVRGVGVYGRSNLEWRKTFAFGSAPNLSLYRSTVDVTGPPVSWVDDGLVVLGLTYPGGTCRFALRAGDAAGLVSWIDSAPPGEHG